jgi:hypothetical protein
MVYKGAKDLFPVFKGRICLPFGLVNNNSVGQISFINVIINVSQQFVGLLYRK